MSEHSWSWTTRAVFPSRAGAHVTLMQEILNELKRAGWAGRDLFGIELALEESLNNAIRHGNRLDESKHVAVDCRISPERFWLRVMDEGCGFDPNAVPDCTAEENIECPGGRGLALIRAYMTHVEHNDCGNCLTMEKVRSATTPLLPSCRPCEPGDSTAK
jgi:serine/threonine-protein kinase RsbW